MLRILGIILVLGLSNISLASDSVQESIEEAKSQIAAALCSQRSMTEKMRTLQKQQDKVFDSIKGTRSIVKRDKVLEVMKMANRALKELISLNIGNQWNAKQKDTKGVCARWITHFYSEEHLKTIREKLCH